MNKISIYVLLILIFLGISKSFSPSEKRIPFIANDKMYSRFFIGSPITVILKESFNAGFLIKTYYHRYSIIHAFRQPESLIVRTTKEFWEYNLKNEGMSLFRRGEGEEMSASSTPMPPGALFIGDPSYGTWEITNYGAKVWSFHRTYKNFPKIFGWGAFVPDLDFFQRMKIHLNDQRSYYGPNNEFGTEGIIQKSKETYEDDDILDENFSFKDNSTLKDTFKSYFTIPSWENNK